MEIKKAIEITEKINKLKYYEIIDDRFYHTEKIKLDDQEISFYAEPDLKEVINNFFEEKISSLKKEIENFK